MKQFLRKINTAKSMPPDVLTKTLVNMVRYKIRKHYIKIFPVKMSDKKFFKASNNKTLDKLPAFFFDPYNKNSLVETIKEEYPGSIPETINTADEICNHIFDLLGSGKTELGKEIDWHHDFKSGFRWNPKEYYIGTGKYVSLDDDSDVKVPWELSRCQHFVTMGKAYLYTGNEKYAKEFVSQIESWIENNPVELGLNWVCTMDVAIRAVNWIWGYYFFCNSKTLTKEFKIKLFKILFFHGRHIINNLEFGYIRGNHYLSDIVGLVYLGILFRETKEGKKWLKKGLSALEEEMRSQVYPDGVDFEASISYHRLVTELFLSATLLCLKNNITFPMWYMDRLEKMIEFVMYYTKPNGIYPVIGDADDGRLHILSRNDVNDHRYLLSIGAVLFERNDFKGACNQFNEEAFWLLGINELKRFKELPGKYNGLKSKCFSDGGFYFMRQNDLYMIIDCVPADNRAPSGHRHNSRLSFELFAYGNSFIIDPGTYIYTADKEMRNLFRSTRYHNTIVVDDEEINRFEKEELFAISSDAVPKVNKWVVTNEYDFFDGEHNGYARLKNPVIHRRQIYFNKRKGYWVIKDILTGEGRHKFDLYFHFAPMKVEFNHDYPYGVESKAKSGSNIIIIAVETQDMSAEIIEGWVSYSYGIKVSAPIMKYSKNVSTPTSFTNIIYPYKGNIDVMNIIENTRNDLNIIKEL